MKTLGQRLLDERERFGYSPSQMATIGGVGRTAQYNYENDIRKPDSDYLAKLADAGIDILYIITGRREGISDLRTEEEKLVDYYRNSPDEGKRILDETARMIESIKKMHKKEKDNQ